MPPFCEQNISYRFSPICQRDRVSSYGGEILALSEMDMKELHVCLRHLAEGRSLQGGRV